MRGGPRRAGAGGAGGNGIGDPRPLPCAAGGGGPGFGPCSGGFVLPSTTVKVRSSLCTWQVWDLRVIQASQSCSVTAGLGVGETLALAHPA